MTTDQFKKYLALAMAAWMTMQKQSPSHPIDVAKAFVNDAEANGLLPTEEDLK